MGMIEFNRTYFARDLLVKQRLLLLPRSHIRLQAHRKGYKDLLGLELNIKYLCMWFGAIKDYTGLTFMGIRG